jgi:hypothetical protein
VAVSAAVAEYLSLLAQLRPLLEADRDESPEAEALYDRMDSAWHAMTAADYEELARQISGRGWRLRRLVRGARVARAGGGVAATGADRGGTDGGEVMIQSTTTGINAPLTINTAALRCTVELIPLGEARMDVRLVFDGLAFLDNVKFRTQKGETVTLKKVAAEHIVLTGKLLPVEHEGKVVWFTVEQPEVEQ